MAKSLKSLKSFQVVDGVIELMLESDKFIESVTKKRDKELREIVQSKFEVGPRQAQRYIREAREEILKINERRKEDWIRRAVRRKEFLIGKSIGSKDFRTANTIDNDLNELLDLKPSKKVQQDNVNFDVDLSKLTKKGLKRIARGDDPKEVLMDPESVRLERE